MDEMFEIVTVKSTFSCELKETKNAPRIIVG